MREAKTEDWIDELVELVERTPVAPSPGIGDVAIVLYLLVHTCSIKRKLRGIRCKFYTDVIGDSSTMALYMFCVKVKVNARHWRESHVFLLHAVNLILSLT